MRSRDGWLRIAVDVFCACGAFSGWGYLVWAAALGFSGVPFWLAPFLGPVEGWGAFFASLFLVSRAQPRAGEVRCADTLGHPIVLLLLGAGVLASILRPLWLPSYDPDSKWFSTSAGVLQVYLVYTMAALGYEVGMCRTLGGGSERA
jgi:hypothetical protein